MGVPEIVPFVGEIERPAGKEVAENETGNTTGWNDVVLAGPELKKVLIVMTADVD